MKLDKDIISNLINTVKMSAMVQKNGGPFGAIVFKDNEIAGIGVNSVLSLHDPTAHAEIQAIRNACQKLGTHDLSGYELYATGYPCPMCMSAIIWANIKKVYYSADYKDAAVLGFRDDFIFHFLKNNCTDINVLNLEQVEKQGIIELYRQYKDNNERIY